MLTLCRGLSIAGSSLGGVIFPIALSKMLYNPKLSFGWTVRILGFLVVAICIPAAFAIRARLPPRTGHFFLPKAFREPLYVSILISQTFVLFGLFTPFFYLPSYALAHGMSPQLSGYLVAILNGSSFFGRIVPGILADKIGPLNMLTVAAFSTGLLILCWQAITTSAGIIVFAVVYGFCSGAIISLNTFALSTIPKNPQNIGTYVGMAMAVSSTAALIGPPINGALVTRYGGYAQSMDLSGVFAITGAIGFLISRHLTGKGMFAKM
jgi:MFS family permease